MSTAPNSKKEKKTTTTTTPHHSTKTLSPLPLPQHLPPRPSPTKYPQPQPQQRPRNHKRYPRHLSTLQPRRKPQAIPSAPEPRNSKWKASTGLRRVKATIESLCRKRPTTLRARWVGDEMKRKCYLEGGGGGGGRRRGVFVQAK